jgi:hypothetical protein
MKPLQTPLNKARITQEREKRRNKVEGDREYAPSPSQKNKIQSGSLYGGIGSNHARNKLRVWLLPIVLLSLVAASPYWSHQQP